MPSIARGQARTLPPVAACWAARVASEMLLTQSGGGIVLPSPLLDIREDAMETRIDEIAPRIYRLSTCRPGAGGGFTFNQFLIDADEPLLFHCGQKPLFASVSSAAARILDLTRLRWITYSHTEADECGSLNEWLTLAPHATPMHGDLGCRLWLNDWAARPPRRLADEEVIELGGKRVRYLDTPNVPHDVVAGLLFEESTATLLCSDLFAHTGDGPALTEDDILAPALALEATFPFTPVTAETAPTIRRLARSHPRTLAVMHGSSFAGDAGAMLERMAQHYDARLRNVRAP